MSYREVKYYQDLGDYEKAFCIAHVDLACNPNLKWPTTTMGWLLISMMKINAKAYAQNKFIAQLETFGFINIPKEETELWGAVAWPIRDIIKDSLEMQWFTPEFGDTLFRIMQTLHLIKPSESYSALAKEFAALGSLWPRLPEFIEWWGFGNFTDFDYRRYPENGRLESLAEKVLTAYLVSLHRGGDGKQPSEAFFKALDNLALRSKEQADKVNKILKYE